MTSGVKLAIFAVIVILSSVISSIVDNLLGIELEGNSLNTIVHKTVYMVIGGALVYYLGAMGMIGAWE